MKKRLCLIILLTSIILNLGVICAYAQENTLKLPDELISIGDEAFMGNASMDTVVLPDKIETIGVKAFANSTIKRINLPESIKSIADDAFDGCESVVGFGSEGSYGSYYFRRHANLVFESTDHRPRSFYLDGINWANHAITCGQDTNNYNAWAPHNLQYDDVRDCFVFLQCHADKHMNATYSTWTLSIINPYDTTDYDCVDIPEFCGLGMLVVDEGVWTLIPRGQSYIYRSSDGGNSWEQHSASIPTYIFGIYKIGNVYFAGNDSNNNNTFYRSTDLSTWTEEPFVLDYDYSVLCESCFCEFKGKIYSFNRTNNSELGCVVLTSDDYGYTWTQCNDIPLHSYRTTTSCIALSDCILIADLDRNSGMLYLQKFDGDSISTVEAWGVTRGGDDFHSVNIATDYNDTIVIEFMHVCGWISPAYMYLDHFACDNVMLVGSRNQLPTLEMTYFSTPDSLLEFSNTYLAKTVSGESLSWEYDGREIKAGLSTNISSFIDEVELPLNFFQITSLSNRIDTTLKSGDSFVRPMNNDLLYSPINQDTHRSVISMSSRIGYVDIKGVRYAYGAPGYECLPVLTRADNLYHLEQYPESEGYNSIVGQEWQKALSFRRVFSIFESTSEIDYISIFNEAILNDSDSCRFALMNYYTVE